MTLPTEIWRTEIWERGLCHDAVTIIRWSLVSTEHRKMYLGHCRGLRIWPRGMRDHIRNADIQRLPRGLLHLHTRSSALLTDACVSHLPRGLLKFHVVDHNRLSDECAEHLPPGLESLKLRTGLLTEVFVASLPDTLKNLHIPGPNIFTDAFARLLPRNLENLTVSHSAYLTEACVEHLPCTLKRLDLGSNRNLIDACARHLPHVDISRKSHRWSDIGAITF